MTDDMLSQDEIDALLKNDENENQDEQELSNDVNDYLSEMEQDALGEIGNIFFGSSSTALSSLLNQKVDITTPTLGIVRTDKLHEEFPKPNVAVHVDYKKGFEGVNLFVIKLEDATVIADLMLGGDGTSPEELNDMALSAVQEAMNQMMGSAATSLSTMFNEKIDINPPTVKVFDISNDENVEILHHGDVLLKNSFRMKVGDLIDSTIMQLSPIPFAKEMSKKMLNPGGASNEHENESSTSLELKPEEEMSISEEEVSNTSKSIQGSHSGQNMDDRNRTNVQQNQENSVQSVQFSNFEQHDNLEQKSPKNLDLLMDISLQVTVELGRTNKAIKDILDLSPGSIVALDKLAGEPVDILVNNKLIAKGEVVVIEENFGVRVTDILSQLDRLNKLQ